MSRRPRAACGLLAVTLAVLAGPAAAQDAPDPQPLPPEAGYLAPEVGTLPEVAHRLIDRSVDYYRGPGRDWLLKTLERARTYHGFIRDKIAAEGLPPEFFWLAAVESGFNPGAVSRTGAAGLWQFMKNSVGGYGMRINALVDERRDFWKSTEGAFAKLRFNYDRLGNWYLALAAYNAGLGRVQAIVRRAGGVTDYWTLLDKGLLPRETAGYVPQLLALSRLAARWDEEGLPAPWDEGPAWTLFPLERSVDLRLLAAAAGLNIDDLRAANRELNTFITPHPTEGYQLKVRADWVEPLRTALADPELKLLRYTLYTVQKGDTLSEIALWYGVSAAMIERDNPGLKAPLLKIGQNLVIAVVRDVGPFRKGSPRG